MIQFCCRAVALVIIALMQSLRKISCSMKKVYEAPSVIVVPLDHQCALLQPSNGDDDQTPGIGKGIAMDSIEQPYNG